MSNEPENASHDAGEWTGIAEEAHSFAKLHRIPLDHVQPLMYLIRRSKFPGWRGHGAEAHHFLWARGLRTALAQDLALLLHRHWDFCNKRFTEQKEEEPVKPLLPRLDNTFRKKTVVDILEDVSFKDVIARGVVTGTPTRYDRRVDVYIPEIKSKRSFTKTRLRVVPKEEL